MASEQQPQLIRCVDAAPVQAQSQHQLEHQVQRALRCPQPLAGVGAQPHTRKDGFDRVAGAQVNPMFFRKVIERDEVRPIALQAGGG